MAGWLKRESDTLQGAQKLGVLFNLGIENNGGSDVNWSFTKFLKAFLEEVYGISCLRSLPPVIGVGQVVDLLKLKIVVRKRGGYCRVSENGLWSSVASDCGVDLRFSAALKLIYVKYLDSLDRWLRKIEKCREEGVSDIEERYLDFSRFLMGLESDPKVFVSSKIERDDGFVVLKKREFEGNKGFVAMDVKGADDKWSNQNSISGDVNISKGQSIDKGRDGDDLQVDQDSVSKKRKRECYTGTLNWIRKVGKDPGGAAVEPFKFASSCAENITTFSACPLSRNFVF